MRRTGIGLVTVLALGASLAHFAWSGVRQPFDHPNLAKFDEEATPLADHLRTGAPVHSPNPAQYGPVFFFVMHPLLKAGLDQVTLAAWLYAIQIVCLVAAFLFTCAALRASVARSENTDARPLAVAWLAILWLNFSPLYTVIALKSVETWELLLIAAGLYAYLRGSRLASAVALAAAALVKMLPFAFIYYWLVTDRRTFVYACAALVALLAAGHLLYGSEMGLWYLPRLVTAAAGNSYGLNWHENVSLKAALAKLFGELPLPTHDARMTSGYFLALTGWRRTAAVALGDAAVVAGVAALTWQWIRTAGDRSRERMLWNWSVLTVAVLVLSPNTVFEYFTIALGAVSYAFVRVAFGRRDAMASVTFAASLLLVGGILPRQWLNRVFFIDAINRWTHLTHLTPSEAYQYYCFPLLGLGLLLVTLWRVRPGDADTTILSESFRRAPKRSS